MSSPASPISVRAIVEPDIQFEEGSSKRAVQDYVVAEFCEYKRLSLTMSYNNFVAKNEGLQAKEPSIHSQFGRDRVFDHPQALLPSIIDENIAHVHYDGDAPWSPEKPQWYCTSHESVVYSAFLEGDGYCFVIHDLLLNHDGDPDFDAHNYYSFKDLEYYVANAEYHRENEQKGS
ncbi:type II toxin-antitoxin system YafO family toxin [Aeromonas salmonicida]|uniref:type II toxin-antitoxin system YafO family toxin n=1 Tax=Aeromonas salmonicida TaxID=645 RepID=UPI003CFF4C7E